MNYNDIKILRILGVLQIFSLCFCDLITGISGIITLVYINKASRELDEEVKNSDIRIAKTINIIGWNILLITIIIEFIINILKYLI